MEFHGYNIRHMSAHAEIDDPDVFQGLCNDLRDNSGNICRKSWILYGHHHNDVHVLSLFQKDLSQNANINDLINHLLDDQVMYGLIRLPVVMSGVRTIKLVYVHWVGRNIEAPLLARYLVIHSSAEEFFRPYQVMIETGNREDLYERELRIKLGDEHLVKPMRLLVHPTPLCSNQQLKCNTPSTCMEPRQPACVQQPSCIPQPSCAPQPSCVPQPSYMQPSCGQQPLCVQPPVRRSPPMSSQCMSHPCQYKRVSPPPQPTQTNSVWKAKQQIAAQDDYRPERSPVVFTCDTSTVDQGRPMHMMRHHQCQWPNAQHIKRDVQWYQPQRQEPNSIWQARQQVNVSIPGVPARESQPLQCRCGNFLVDAIKSIHDHCNPLTWLIAGFDGDVVLRLLAKGSGGIEEMKASFQDDDVQFGLYRTVMIMCGVQTYKFVAITWIGPHAHHNLKGKTSYVHCVEDAFAPVHICFYVEKREHLSEILIHRKIKAGRRAVSYIGHNDDCCPPPVMPQCQANIQQEAPNAIRVGHAGRFGPEVGQEVELVFQIPPGKSRFSTSYDSDYERFDLQPDSGNFNQNRSHGIWETRSEMMANYSQDRVCLIRRAFSDTCLVKKCYRTCFCGAPGNTFDLEQMQLMKSNDIEVIAIGRQKARSCTQLTMNYSQKERHSVHRTSTDTQKQSNNSEEGTNISQREMGDACSNVCR